MLAVETPDHPGGLNAVLKPLRSAGINVHYLYPHLGRVSDQAIVILGVDRTKRLKRCSSRTGCGHWARKPTASDSDSPSSAYLRPYRMLRYCPSACSYSTYLQVRLRSPGLGAPRYAS